MKYCANGLFPVLSRKENREMVLEVGNRGNKREAEAVKGLS